MCRIHLDTTQSGLGHSAVQAAALGHAPGDDDDAAAGDDDAHQLVHKLPLVRHVLAALHRPRQIKLAWRATELHCDRWKSCSANTAWGMPRLLAAVLKSELTVREGHVQSVSDLKCHAVAETLLRCEGFCPCCLQLRHCRYSAAGATMADCIANVPSAALSQHSSA